MKVTSADEVAALSVNACTRGRLERHRSRLLRLVAGGFLTYLLQLGIGK
jgi:hypothetical protein